MKRPTTKERKNERTKERKNTCSVADAKTRLALAREITQLSAKLRASVAELQCTLRKARVNNLVPSAVDLKA